MIAPLKAALGWYRENDLEPPVRVVLEAKGTP